MKKNNLLFVILFSGLISITACDNKKSGRNAPSRVARGGVTQNQNNNNINNNNSNFNNQGNYNTNGSDVVYLGMSNPSDFLNSLKGLVSAVFDPAELGNVNNYSDVKMRGYIDMDRSFKVNRSNSSLVIEIVDDYAKAGTADKITLSFNNLFDSRTDTNPISLTFKDDYGYIILNGNLSEYDFTGEVTYKNLKSFDSSSQFANGSLGQFQIPVCSFFRCN